MQLENKRALVTGGSRGIGRGIVLALAQKGADVAFTYERSEERAKEVETTVQQLGRKVFPIQADSQKHRPCRHPCDRLPRCWAASTSWSITLAFIVEDRWRS